MYRSDYFTKEQMTKYEILSDANKGWDKTLAHFTARPTATTRQLTADLKAQHMPVTTHLPTALPPPTPRMTSLVTST
jgi:hypothetical protein